MPYSAISRGMTQFGAGIGQAIGDHRNARKDHKTFFTAYENSPAMQAMFPGLDPDSVSAREASQHWEAFNQLMEQQRQQMEMQRFEMLQQQHQQQMMAQEQDQRSRRAMRNAVTPHGPLAEMTPYQSYAQAAGDAFDPRLFESLQRSTREQQQMGQGVEFAEDPVSGHRFATFGRSMAGSGVNPAMAAQGEDPQQRRTMERQHQDRLERTFVREGGFGDQQRVTPGQYWNETRLPDGRIRPGADIDPSIERWLELLDEESMALYGRPAFGQTPQRPQRAEDVANQFFGSF